MKHFILFAAATLASARSIKRDLTVQTVNGWNSAGCYSDLPLNRTLGYLIGVGEDISGTSCQTSCGQRGFLYAGVEFGGQCYCDNSTNPISQAAASGCTTPCPADSTQPCGGKDRINLFSTQPVNPSNVNGYTYSGCYSDNVAARTLRHSMNIANVTPQSCVAACSAAGYSLAGTEYAGECFCDNYINNGQSPIAASSCNMACKGDAGTLCGGAAAMSLYASGAVSAAPKTQVDPVLPSDWTALGCYTDDVSKRALPAAYVGAPSGGMTVEFCVSSCKGAGFQAAGVEYGGECYCDNSVQNAQTLASDSTTCNMACSGQPGETCGGPNRINIYAYSPAQ